MVGTITYFNGPRRFGFITTKTGERYFFHVLNFKRGHQPVLEGRVEFEVGLGIAVGKPPQAVNVRYVPNAQESNGGAL